MDKEISQLIQFGIDQELLREEDIDYAINLILDLLHIDDFKYLPNEDHFVSATPMLTKLLDYAVEKEIIQDNLTERDLFDTRLMNCLMPRPSEVIETFNKKYKVSPKQATDYFYRLSIASQYIRKERTDKNIVFKRFYKYGNIVITINLSKPEKDPKEIAKAKESKVSHYPKCLLCKENVGFSGDLKRNARQSHRIIPVKLDGDDYFLQYSPYVYYNEHCIVFNKEHTPMIIERKTLSRLLSFVDLFPHYMIGSNADLPIVGGSILTHDHFQGGHFVFPIEGAQVIKSVSNERFPSIRIEVLKWPLSTIRLTSVDKEDIVECANSILRKWIDYSNEQLDILAYTNETRHNTVTPIARKSNGKYQMDIVLRNNRQSKEYPDGIFHPHKELHHIKKENIGLIEVMGLAVLPARLKDEISLLKKCLLQQANIEDFPELDKHKEWYHELKQLEITQETIDELLEQALVEKFVNVLENAGVFKMNDEGIEAFVQFVESI